MKRVPVIIAVISVITLVPALILIRCLPPPIPVPYISHIDPSKAGPGEFLILKGQNMNYANYIHFGQEKIWINSASGDSLTVEIPSLDPGPINIFLEYFEGVSNMVDFTVLPARPLITALVPETIGVLDTLTILGRNFQQDAEVYLGSLLLDQVTLRRDTLIKVVIPVKAVSGNIRVKTGAQESFSKFLAVTNPKAPVITSLVPDVFLIGDTVVVEGENFSEDSLQVRFNEVVAEQFSLKSPERIEIRVPEIASSGFISVKTIYGEDKKPFELLDPVSLAPVIQSASLTAYKGDTVAIVGRNFQQGTLFLLYDQVTLQEEFYAVISDQEISLFTDNDNESGLVTIGNEFGSVDLSLTLKNLPVIQNFLPLRNPADWPLIIRGDHFDEILQIVFEKNGVNFTLSINDEGVQYLPLKQTIGLKVPGFTPGSYKIFLRTAGGRDSNEIDYFILDTPPEGLPGSGSPNLVIPNNPPAAFLSAFENTWSMINTGKTINFTDETSGQNTEYGIVSEVFHDDLSGTGTYKRDGTEIEFLFTDDLGSYEYEGSLDDLYWDDPGENSGVYRAILTPLLEGTQVEMIFPVGLENIEPASAFPADSIVVHGRLFHEFEFYEIQITGENGTILVEAVYKSSTELKFNAAGFGLKPGNYKVQVFFNGALSNSLNLEILQE
jgi:hypothetical protein